MQPELKIVMDEWAQPPEPETAVQISWMHGYISARWQFDATVSATVAQPGPLVLVTGI